MKQYTKRDRAEEAFIKVCAYLIRESGIKPGDPMPPWLNEAQGELATIMFYAGFTPDDLKRITKP